MKWKIIKWSYAQQCGSDETIRFLLNKIDDKFYEKTNEVNFLPESSK